MANTSYLGANVVTSDSFAGWINKTNQVRHDMGTVAVTVTTTPSVEPNTTNGGYTSGNAAIAGVLTANTIAVSQYLRGGTVTTSAGLTISSNATFTGQLVNINGNTIIGDAGTDTLIVNAVSDLNANVNIDGILTVTSNAVFSGESVNISGNTTIGDAGTDRLVINAVLASDLIPLDTTIDLGSVTSTYGNLHSVAVYTKDITASNNATVTNTLTVNAQANAASIMVRNLTSTRIPYIGTAGQVVDSANLTFSGTGLTVSGILSVGNTTVTGLLSTTTLTSGNAVHNGTLATGNTIITGTLAANNTTIAGALSSTTLSSGNTIISGTLAANATTITGLLSTTTLSSGNTTIVGTLDANNTTITGTLAVTALSTLASANVTSALAVTGATTLRSTLNVNNAIVASNTLNVTGLSTLSSANITVLATMASASVTGLATMGSANVTGLTTVNTINATGAANLASTLAVSGIATLSSDLVLSGTGARTIKADAGTGVLGSVNLVVANSTVGSSNTVLIANTTGVFASANVAYDLGSSATSWRNVYVKDAAIANSATIASTLTVNSQANTASLMIRNLTATRIPYIGTAGQVIDSANLTFSGTGLAIIGTLGANNTIITGTFGVTSSANVGGTLGVVGAITASNTLNITGMTTMSTANITSNAIVGGTLGVTGLSTLASANIGSLNITGITTVSSNVDIATNKNLRFGSTPDLLIYSDGANSYIKENGSGTLNIDTSQLNIVTSNSSATNTIATFVRSGAVTLYHNDIARIATTSTGAQITGDLNVSGGASFGTGSTVTYDIASAANSSVTSWFRSTGNTIIGDSNSDIVQFNAYANSSIIASANVTYDLGTTGNRWNYVYANTVQAVAVNAATITTSNTIVWPYHTETSQTATLATTVATTIASFSVASFGAAEATIVAKRSSARYITKLLITHDGTTAYATEYGSIATGTAMASYSINITAGILNIVATSDSTSSTTFNTALTLINA